MRAPTCSVDWLRVGAASAARGVWFSARNAVLDSKLALASFLIFGDDRGVRRGGPVAAVRSWGFGLLERLDLNSGRLNSGGQDSGLQVSGSG